ncbi:MAG: hypothetical protein Q7W05_00150 [Deltaproteobacteria bacterium]|jgi:hypothetical protein|nr:hypothetical protein [Deltaproteobacteria bacterium]
MAHILKINRATRWQAVMAAGLLLAASPPRAELAGRFFFTPQERAALDVLRHNIVAPGVRAASGPITVNGLVTSSRGTSTVWINGAPQHESEQITATKKKGSPGEITVKLPDSTRQRRLKVGQTLTLGNGEIREGYQSTATSGDPNSAKK